MCSVRRYSGISLSGLPHSEISGSKAVCASPKLIAAYHVLHRLSVPRHPPCALSSFFTLPVAEIGLISFALHRCQRTARLPRMKYNGGDGRARTGDPRLAKPVLSQLSYTPPSRSLIRNSLVGLTRVELVTSRLSGVRSNQLSYRPKPEITLYRLQVYKRRQAPK
jgi:hypothetical protein